MSTCIQYDASQAKLVLGIGRRSREVAVRLIADDKGHDLLTDADREDLALDDVDSVRQIDGRVRNEPSWHEWQDEVYERVRQRADDVVFGLCNSPYAPVWAVDDGVTILVEDSDPCEGVWTRARQFPTGEEVIVGGGTYPEPDGLRPSPPPPDYRAVIAKLRATRPFEIEPEDGPGVRWRLEQQRAKWEDHAREIISALRKLRAALRAQRKFPTLEAWNDAQGIEAAEPDDDWVYVEYPSIQVMRFLDGKDATSALCQGEDLTYVDLADLGGKWERRKTPEPRSADSERPAERPTSPRSESWLPADLDDVLDGTYEVQTPSILHRADGPALLYPGRIHGLNAEPEAGKGWLAIQACAEVMLGGDRALYLDLEDTRENVVGRLVALGVPREVIRERLGYVQPEEPAKETAIERLVDLKPALVVIDSTNEAMTLQGLDYVKNDDVVKFIRLMARPFKNAGAAVLLLDHVTKDKETRGRYAIGGQQKLAAVDVTYMLEVVRQFSRGNDGLVRLKVSKDRPAGVRPHAVGTGAVQHAADLALISHEDGSVSVRLDPPPGALVTMFERPEKEMEAISRYLESEEGRIANSKRAIEDAVPYNTNKVRTALDLLVGLEHVEQTKGARGAFQHRIVRPYRAREL